MSYSKVARRNKIRTRIRSKVFGTPDSPRLAVFRSNTGIYAQVIDDVNGKTLASSSSSEFKTQKITKVAMSSLVGKSVAEKAKSVGISKIVFDRGGFLYHGRIKALADGAREAGLVF